ncbi:MAG: serine/threonine-protein kinase [Planctomycetota bacterium]
MARNASSLLLVFAIRRGLVSAEAALRIADDCDSGGDLRRLLLETGRLDEPQLKALEAEAEAWRAVRTQNPVELEAANRSDVTVPMLPSDPSEAPLPAVRPAFRYVLGEELGSGGVGRVVEAIDQDFGRRVALKILKPGAGRAAVERLQTEARITGQLEHPNIVPVHEIGTLPRTNEVFFSMKRIVGRDMRQVIRDGTWRPRRLVEAFRDVCRAIAYAHAKGIIHRDLKPANVMLGDFGEVLVVDWGLARVVGPRVLTGEPGELVAEPRRLAKTPSGLVRGTPSYMSPEQAAGNTELIDERSDVYGLGATLYEILSGRAPFESPALAETIKLVLAGNPPPPAKFRKTAPELDRICLKAMALKREDRYGSVVEMGQDLEEFLQGPAELL